MSAANVGPSLGGLPMSVNSPATGWEDERGTVSIQPVRVVCVCVCVCLCTGSHLDLGLDPNLAPALAFCWSGARARARHGTARAGGRQGYFWEGDIRQERAVSVHQYMCSRHCRFQRDPEVSGLPKWRLVALPDDEWALGSSGCGVTLGCERLFLLLMEDFDLPDQNQTSKWSGVSGCRWGEGRERALASTSWGVGSPPRACW